MTTITQKPRVSRTADSLDGFAALAARILEIRSIFMDHLDLLPGPFNKIVKDHYIARVVRAEDRYMLGEYAPFFLADLFQISASLPERISIPWLTLYEHSLLVDDIVDITERNWPQQLFASQLLFDDVLSLWRERFHKYPDLWRSFCKYHEEGISAASMELMSGEDLPQASLGLSDIHISMGRKAALVKFCAATFSIEERGRVLTSIEESAIDKLCAGVQLLDDLSDCVEDYKNDRYTYPLNLAFRRLQLSDSVATTYLLNSDQVLFAVMVSGAASHVADLVRHYFEDGLASLNVRSDSATGAYIESLVGNCYLFTQAFERLSGDRADLVKTILASLHEQKQITETQSKMPFDRFWTEMKNCFKIIAVAAN